MFVEAIKRINIKISKTKIKGKLVKILKEKIDKNPILKSQWENYLLLNSKKKSITEKKQFVSLLKGFKNVDSKELNKATENLLKEFKINHLTVFPNKLDEAIEKKSKILADFVIDKKNFSLKEEFKRIIESRDQESLNFNLKIIDFYNHKNSGLRKKMIFESIKSIKSKKNDFKSLAIKTYQLRKLMESFLTEKVINSKIENIDIFKDIDIKLTDEKLILNFKIDVTPVAKNCQRWMVNANNFKKTLSNSQSVFLSKCVDQTELSNLIDTDFTLWNVKMLCRVMTNKELNTTVPASFKIFLNLKKTITSEESRNITRKMLENFSSILKNYLGDKVDYLDPAVQNELVNSLGDLRSWGENRYKPTSEENINSKKKGNKEEMFDLDAYMRDNPY